MYIINKLFFIIIKSSARHIIFRAIQQLKQMLTKTMKIRSIKHRPEVYQTKSVFPTN